MHRRNAAILALALMLTLSAIGTAHATASLECTIKDRGVEVELMGNVGSGDGAAIQIPHGSIKISAIPGKYPAMEFEIEAGQVVQQWTFGNELRMALRPEDKNDISVYLVIMAQIASGKHEITQYRGRYVLRVQGPKGEAEFKGPIKSCSAG
jgi:hypothetical protein